MEKGEGRLCALVLVRPIRMQTITAATCRGIVDWQVQVVSPQKPFEGTAGFLVPSFFSGSLVSFQTGRDHGMWFDRLLIKAGPFASLRIKTVRTDGDEMLSLCVCMLDFGDPAERFQTHFRHRRI